MRDGIMREQGNSRFLKSDIPLGTTIEQLVAMFRNGAFPIDMAGINPDGWVQIGTALNKGNLLSDETQVLLGMPLDSENFTGTVDLALREAANTNAWSRFVSNIMDFDIVGAIG